MNARRLFLIGTALIAGCSGSAAPRRTSQAQAARQLILLAGQSNMAGRARVETQDKIEVPRVLMLDRSLNWVPALDPMHFDKPQIVGVGPGRAFAITLADTDTSLQIGLIPASVGGTPMASWEPGALDISTQTRPYDQAIVRTRAAMTSGDLKALLWHQGESDATPQLAPAYERRLRALILRFRQDLGTPGLPFIVGQLGRFSSCPWDAARETIDSVQQKMASQLPNVAFVSSAGLTDVGDCTHFDAASARELGRRYAKEYLRLINK